MTVILDVGLLLAGFAVMVGISVGGAGGAPTAVEGLLATKPEGLLAAKNPGLLATKPGLLSAKADGLLVAKPNTADGLKSEKPGDVGGLKAEKPGDVGGSKSEKPCPRRGPSRPIAETGGRRSGTPNAARRSVSAALHRGRHPRHLPKTKN